MCSYRKLKNLEQEDSKTITTMLREFIKIEFVIHNNSNQRKKKLLNLRFVNTLLNYNKIFCCNLFCCIYQTIFNIKNF